MRWVRFNCMGLAALLLAAAAVADDTPSIEAFTKEFQAQPGFIDLWWDPKGGKVWAKIEDFNTPFLYLTALAAGVGSNDLGLDRGRLGDTRMVEFRRVGNRVLLVQPNQDYQAVSDNAGEKLAVREAFAESVLAGFDIGAVSNDSVVVDLSSLINDDALSLPEWLKLLDQGDYQFDTDRSGVLADRIKTFPNNVVIESLITLSGSGAGDALASVVPTPGHVTVRQRHNFIELPETPMQPRAFHPRSGFFYTSFKDYAVPLGADMDQRLIARHRLSADQTLTYYVDSGAPEPIRSALLDGARWWADAFAAAGLPNAFKVEVLPDGADPLDIRYNVIQWVHRSTRGWSYGMSVIDPRSGEILKGHVSLGSLRVRQDMLIAEGLTAPFDASSSKSDAVERMALARLRQLSAHEVGHTLGLAHNYAASVNNDASVMDYPHPMIGLSRDGEVVLDNAYDVGIGEWDKLAIRYGYTAFDADETVGLAKILKEAETQGQRYVTDQDSRAPSSGHAIAHLWDSGPDPVARLQELIDIRATALKNFSEQVIRDGRPLSLLEQVLVPVYLLHRYQLEAAAHQVGGSDYGYPMRGDAQRDAWFDHVSDEAQRAALDAMLSTLTPEFLALSDDLLSLIPPPAFGYDRDREFFTHATGADFDALAPARAAATLTVSLLLEPARLARLDQRAGDGVLSADDVIRRLTDVAWPKRTDDNLRGVRQAVGWATTTELMRLAASDAIPPVRALAVAQLERLAGRLPRSAKNGDAFGSYVRQQIEWFLEDPMNRVPENDVVIPPGSPI